ncbi:MAG TPA: glycosyltransferase family 1 protein [Jatrophihabitans sp.]|jgi:glycosyltransferase involved in cell wall biosynthesis
MRVALVSEQLLSPVPGGTGRYTAELGAALARTAAGDDVTGWIAWHRRSTAAWIEGVTGPRRLALPRRALIAAWERGLGPAPRAADLVHAPTPLLPPRRDRPLVCTVHDTVPWTHPETLNPRGVRWHRTMIQRAAEVADLITVPTQVVADDLVSFVPTAAGRIEVLGGGVARRLLIDPSPEEVAAVRSRYSLPDRFVMTLATAEPRKGLGVLLDAMVRLGSNAPSLILVGPPGWGGVDIVADAATKGLAADKIRVLSRVSDPELAVLLRLAGLLIMPSLAEGFGLPVAEAMAVGTPVLCSDAPALLEVGGPAVRAVPRQDPVALADALADLLASDDERSAMIRAGLERGPAFDWDAVARRAWASYAKLTG